MAVSTSPWIKLIAIIFYISYGRPSQAKIHYRYMTNYCSKTIHIEDSLVLALTSLGSLPEDRDRDFVHCELDLLAPKGMKLYAHFLQMGISPDVDHSDRLHLYDLGGNNTRLTPIKGLYGKLDRMLSIFDNSGSQINDYRTRSNMMKVDYLGKPTKTSPGFRLLVTNFQDPGYGDECPSRHYLCSHPWICIPRQTMCDGNPNCGKDDASDERGCDRYDTVTNLLAEYSLVRDIIVAILLPLAIFNGIVIAVFILAKRYIREKINKPELPTVYFTHTNEGRVRVAEGPDSYAPPPYDDILGLPERYDPPPAYTGLSHSVGEDRAQAEAAEKAAMTINSEHKQSRREVEVEPTPLLVSTSNTDGREVKLRADVETSEYENYRLHCVWPSDTDDDEDMKAKRRRKGGKGKVKGKRIIENRGNVAGSSLKNLPIVPVLSEELTASKNSVPSSDSAGASLTADSSSTNASSPDLPKNSDLTLSPVSFTQPDLKHQDSQLANLKHQDSQLANLRHQDSQLANLKHHHDSQLAMRSSEDFIPIHITPSKSAYVSMPCFDKLPEDCLKSTKTCSETVPEIQVTAHLAVRSSIKDTPSKDVLSTNKQYTSSGEKFNEDTKNVHKIPKQDKRADKTVTSFKMDDVTKIVTSFKMDDDEDADVSSGSDSGASVVVKQKGKTTSTTCENPVGNGYLPCA